MQKHSNQAVRQQSELCCPARTVQVAMCSARFCAWMVVLWILSGARARRILDPKPVPFQGGKRSKRRVNLTVRSDVVHNCMERLQLEPLQPGVPYVHGTVDLQFGAACSHSNILLQIEREFYWYWRSMGVPATELWSFAVASVDMLPEPVPAAEYIARRFSRVFTALSGPTVEELCSMFANVPAYLEAERRLADPEDLRSAVLIPLPFAQLLMRGQFRSFLLPSPKAQGWWRAPKWFQNALNPELVYNFERSRRELPAGMTDEERFSLAKLRSAGPGTEDLPRTGSARA